MNFGCLKYLFWGFVSSALFFDQAFAAKTRCEAKHTEQNISQNEKRQSVLKRLAKLKINYVSPASGVDENFRREYQKDIKKCGLLIPQEALIDKNICRFSDTDENRWIRLKLAINSDSKIVWATRGGFGSYKLVDSLNNLPQPKKRKILIGFSDITALNLFVAQNWKDWTVIHAPMVVHLAKDQYHHSSWTLLLDILENKIQYYTITGLTPLNESGKEVISKGKKVIGKLTGGNLTLIESSLKTNWEVDTDNKILFIEDCHESAPSVYRSMYHLKSAGKLSKVKAIIFGHFVGVSEYIKYLRHFASEMDIPIFITDQFGHGKKNLPLVYNADGVIEGNSLIVNLSHKD